MRLTGPGNALDWTRTRAEAAVYALTARGIPLETALPLARAVLAHWARETGNGSAETDYNLGNIHRGPTSAAVPSSDPGWHGAISVRPDAGAQVEFRAYETLRDGVADYLRLLEQRLYRDAWAYLLTHPTDAPGWYRRTLAAGYSPLSDDAVAEYASIYTGLARRLGPDAQ